MCAALGEVSIGERITTTSLQGKLATWSVFYAQSAITVISGRLAVRTLASFETTCVRGLCNKLKGGGD